MKRGIREEDDARGAALVLGDMHARVHISQDGEEEDCFGHSYI